VLFPPLLIVAVLAAWQQLPPRDVVKSAGPTATISGRVTEAGSGRPLRQMRVHLTGRDIGNVYGVETLTDAEGRYEITGLRGGAYWINAGPGQYRAGHLSKTFGADELPAGVPPLQLKPGEVRRNVDFALPRSYAIEGRVVNEFGEPLSEVSVGVQPIKAVAHVFRTLQTDDRGHFRIYGLGAGTWRLCAEARNTGFDRPVTAELLQHRFIRACVPADGGPPIVLKDSDATGVIIQLHRARAYTVSGRVVLESGAVPERASISVHRVERDNFQRMSSDAPVEYSSGRFVARGLPPGDYVVRATIPAAAGENMPGAPPREFAAVPVTVDAADVTGVFVATTSGVDIAGRIVFEAETKPPLTASGLRVFIGRDDETSFRFWGFSNPPTTAAEDLSFQLRRLFGPLRLMVAGLPTGWIVKEIRYAGSDIADIATEFTRDPASQRIEVMLTNRTARLSARAVDDSGQPAIKATVVLMPVDERRWKGGLRTSRGGTSPDTIPARDGTFDFGPLRPGDYFIAAVSSEDLSRLYRAGAPLKALSERAQKITLRENDHPTLDVRVVTLPEGQ
jgi:hypothetical protein